MKLSHHLAFLALLALASCASAPQAVPPAEIMAHGSRAESDRAQDERRKTAETLAVFGVRPGDAVFEIEAGGGYWTELLSIAAGPEGQVVMQNPAGFIPFVREDLDRRFTPGRLTNVRQSVSMFDSLDAPDASIDVVTWVQGPHEVYYLPSGESLGDPAKSYSEIFRILRPGGVFVAIDHAAPAGAPQSTGNDVHRIDPAIVIAMAEAAGFEAAGSHDFLLNLADPLTQNVFDPAIRGRTSQFVLRFVKPE